MAISSVALTFIPPSIQPIVNTASTFLSTANHALCHIRRMRSPHLFALGEGLTSALSHTRAFTVAAHVLALSRTLLATHQSFQDLKWSWHKLVSVRLFPSTSVVVFLAALQKGSIAERTIQVYADRVLVWVQYLYETIWNVVKTICTVHELMSTIFWSEETARNAESDCMINLQACGNMLFDEEQGSLEEVLQAIEFPIKGLLSCFGLRKMSSSIFEVTKVGLKQIQTVYQHVPSRQSFLEMGLQGGRIATRTVVG